MHYQYKDVRTHLLNKLEESKRSFPHEYSKPIYVPTILHDNAQKQFELCLRQASEEHSGERILLIPHQLENYQWSGILLEFNTNNLIKRAEYIDPMTGINTIPNEIQEQFREVYSPNILQMRHMKKSNDTNNSANLTIVNLVEAVIQHTTKGNNQQRISELQKLLNSGLGEHNFDNIEELETEIGFVNDQIQLHKKRKKMVEVEKELKILHKLEELKRVSDEILFLSTAVSSEDTIDDQSIELSSSASSLSPQHTISDQQIRKRMYIDELRHDLAPMPECSEKTVLELLVYFEEKLLEGCILSQEDNLDKILLQKLHDQVKKEKLLSESGRTICNELEMHVASNNCQSIVRCLDRLLKAIRPLNVLEIERLISKANQAAELIRDKDIVLLIGPTGSGKSTTVQFLVGCRMIRTNVEIAHGKSLQHITADDTFSRNIQLNGVKSSPFSRSETRYIAPIVVQLRDVIGPSENGTIILCDGPGFGDTAGPEVDIANSLGVIEALKEARSVKLLVLSSYDTLGGRGEGIQKLARILINMIENINERLYAIFYAFSKYPTGSNISSLLTDIQDSKVDADPILQSDDAFRAILTDMIDKSSYTCCKIDPLNDSPKALLKKLKGMKGIQHPSEVFRFPMNDETRNIIDKHMQINKNYVDYAMKQKDTKLVMHYLKTFKRLVDLIQRDDIRHAYKDLIRSIAENMNEYCNAEVNKFNRLIASQDGLKEEDVHEYKMSVDYLQQIQFIKEDLELSLPSHLILTQNIITQFKRRENILNDEDLYSPLIGIYLDNFLMIKTTFSEFEIDYNNSCKMFEKRFDDFIQSARNAIVSNDFERITEFLFKISKSVEILQKHLEQSVAKKYKDIIEVLLSRLSEFSDKIESILVKNTLTIDDMQILTNDIEILKSTKENYVLRELIAKYKQTLKNTAELVNEKNLTDLDGIYDEYIDKIIKYVDEISQRIKVILEKNEEYALENVEKFVNDINTIRTIPEIEFKTVRVYYNTIENIRNYMQQLQPYTQQLLQSIDQQSGNVDDRQLVRLFSSLKNTKWIDNISPGIYEMSYIRLKQELIDYAQQLTNRLRKLDLSLKHPDNVSIACDILEKMDNVCTLQQDIPQLEQYQEYSHNSFVRRVLRVLISIQKDFGFSADTVASGTRSSVTEHSDSGGDLLDIVIIPDSSKRKRTREQIRNDRHALEDQIKKMNFLVDTYNSIINSGRFNLIRLLVKPFQKPSNPRNTEEALYHIQAHGFQSIDALKETIAKFKKELQRIDGEERQLLLTESFSQTKSETTSDAVKPPSDKVRLSEANDALLYVKHCENCRCDRVQEGVVNSHKILQNYLDKYIMSLIEQKIIENFTRIFGMESQNEADLYKYALELELGLYELHSLRKLNSVFLCIDGNEKIEQCRQIFSQNFRTLSTNLQQYKTNEKSKNFKEQLFIAQILSCMDHFCGAEFECNGYGMLYRKYQAELIEGCEKTCVTILECINRNDYPELDLALSHIDDKIVKARTIAQIKHDLECSLNKLMNDIEYGKNYLDDRAENEENIRKHVGEIRQNIENFRFVLDRPKIIEYLQEKTKYCIENFNKKIDSILSTSFSMNLASIEILINNGNFSEAEKEMNNLKYLQRELSRYFASEDIIQKIKTVEERLNDVVTEILNQNDFSDISNYTINPPNEILNKLATTATLYGDKYWNACRNIRAHIKETFTLAITNVRKLPLTEQSMKIRSFEYSLQYLPDELRDSFKSELEVLKISINEEEKVYKQKMDMYFNGGDDDEHIIEKIGELAMQLKKQKLHEQLNELCNKTLKKLFIHRTDVRAALDRQDVRLAINIIEKIFKYETCLGNHIIEIKEVCESVYVLTSRKFLNCCKTVADISLIEETLIVEKAFDDIVIYLECSQNIGALFSNINLQSSIEEIEKMFKYFHDNLETFPTAFNAMNILEIHKTMMISHKWNNFIEKLKQCRTKHNVLQQLLTKMRNVIQYRDMISELENQVNHLKSQVEVDLINNDTSKFEIKRFELHTNIMTSMQILRGINLKFKDILSSMFDVKELERNLNVKVQRICDQLISKACIEQLSIKDTDDFRMFYNHLISLKKCITFLSVDIQHFLELAEDKILDKIRALRVQMTTNNISLSDVAQVLCQMKFLAENLSMFDKKINDQIDEALTISKQKCGMLDLMKLIVELEKSAIGSRLINEHSCLTGASWKRRRDKMQKQDDLDYVLKELKGDDIYTEQLRTRYQTFRQKYDELISNNLKLLDSNTDQKPDVDSLVTQVKFLVGSLVHTSKPTSWNHAFIDDIPQLLAYIFAIWTLKNTQHYNTMRGVEAAQSYLLIPHVAQVIAVFRLLGIGYHSRVSLTTRNVSTISKSLLNNLVEIGTGEGKSVVMAITACVFALTGVDVNCSCYSRVLSTRDESEFAPVFSALGIEERIQYGTFDELCEQFLNEQCDVRVKVRHMIKTNQSALHAIDMTISTRPRVLLIDEVDVFLSDQYYGRMYRPVVVLKDPPIKALLDALWQNKALKTLNDIRSLSEYKKCTTQYSHWVFLFDEAIKDMLYDLQSFKLSKYIVQNDTICYVSGEMVTDDILCGYDTIWAYYYEHEKGNITSDSLKENVGLIVHCGTFSYAEMPHEFSYIAGVTGTLRTLAESEKDILRKTYAIERKTLMPSVFEKGNRTYHSTTDVHVVTESEYFIRIRAEIDRIRNAGRAILVFFESEKELMNFSNSPELSSIAQEEVQLVTEMVDVKERDLYVKRASTIGKVTLLTRIFGRGTDFVCDNRDILEHGGFHVLQTFFSKELSEEYQIMGRTARQGDPGSYGMLLLDKDLEWVLGSGWKYEIANISRAKLYEILNKFRTALYETKCATKGLSIEQCQNEHRLSRGFMTALSKGDIKSVKIFLSDRNRGVQTVECPVRTILLLSEKPSGFTVLDLINGTISTIVKRTSSILKQMGLNSEVIQIQFVIDRNDNLAQNMPLEISSWYNRASDLVAFVNTVGKNIRSFGPISTGLQHAAGESERSRSISQVIMIGDALANNERQPTYQTETIHDSYRIPTYYHRTTNYCNGLERLRAKNIPVHTFYLNRYVEDSFREIAKRTGGRCMGERGYSPRCAKLVTNFVAEEIIRKVAGIAGDTAVELYRTKYVTPDSTS